MSGYLLLGIDIGTTATKGILLDPARGLVATAEAPSTLRSPNATWAEEDPEEWWTNVALVTRGCLAQVGARGEDVAAVGVSGMVPCVILVDEAGRVLRPSIQQNDARAVEEIAFFRALFDETTILQRTGSAITQQSIGPKLQWLRSHEPAAMAAAAYVMGSYDYIVYRLTGCRSCERNWALESGLFDVQRGEWDDAVLAQTTITREHLGTVRWPAEIAGEVTAAAAAATGLAVGTPVVAGSADHISSAFSAGVQAPGDLLVKLGGAGDILYALDHLVVDSRLFLDYHVIPGRYLINGCMASSGSIIKWFWQQFAPQMDYAGLDAEAMQIAPGSDGLVLLPYFLGEKTPINDPEARGVLFGLTLSHTRAHVYRAILEGIAFGFRHHLEVLAELGLVARRVRVTNGGARSKLWKQVVADVLELPLEQLVAHPGSSLGAAFLAGKGVGLFANWEEIERFISVSATIEPGASARGRYDSLFAVYRELYERNRGLFSALRGGIKWQS